MNAAVIAALAALCAAPVGAPQQPAPSAPPAPGPSLRAAAAARPAPRPDSATSVARRAATAALAGAAPHATPPSAAAGRAAAEAPPDASPAAPADFALSRRQAIDSALAHNPQLEAARQQVAQARARVVQARAIPDPSLSASLDDQSTFLGASAARTVGLGVTLPFPDKIRLRGKVAGADVDAAESDYTLLRQQIAAETWQTYDALLVALRHRQDLRDGQQLATDFVQRTQARYNAGTAARLDVIKAQVDASQVQNDLIASERDIANARAALNRLIGRALGTPVTPADSLTAPPPLPDLDSLRARAARLRPELLALDAERSGARAATTLAREYWLPDINLGISGSGQPGSPRAYATGISIGFPIFFWQHGSGEVAEARHHERELAADQLDLSAQIDQDVRAAYADASTALRQVAFIRDQLLPETQDAYRIASTSYALGGSSALEVLDAKRALLDAQTQDADALGAANDAIARLELAVGAPLAEISGGQR